jgi:WD40 repeat protein
LVAVDWNGAAAIFDVTSPQSPSLLTTLLHHEQQELGNLLYDVAFSPNGQYVAVAGVNGVRVWRGQQGSDSFAQPQHFATPTNEYSIALQFSPDSRRIVWQQHTQGQVGVWNLESAQGEPIALKVPASLAYFGEQGHLLHLAGKNESDRAPMLRITDPTTGQSSVLDWQHVPGIVKELDFSNRFSLSRDQQWLALMGANVTMWDMTARRLIIALPPEASPVNTLAWSPDRSQLALGRTDGTIAIWNMPEVNSQLATIGLAW